MVAKFQDDIDADDGVASLALDRASSDEDDVPPRVAMTTSLRPTPPSMATVTNHKLPSPNNHTPLAVTTPESNHTSDNSANNSSLSPRDNSKSNSAASLPRVGSSSAVQDTSRPVETRGRASEERITVPSSVARPVVINNSDDSDEEAGISQPHVATVEDDISDDDDRLTPMSKKVSSKS